MTTTGLTTEAKNGTAAVNENVRLTTVMKALDGALSPGQALRNSGKLMMSSHGSTAEIYDSWAQSTQSASNGLKQALQTTAVLSGA